MGNCYHNACYGHLIQISTEGNWDSRACVHNNTAKKLTDKNRIKSYRFYLNHRVGFASNQVAIRISTGTDMKLRKQIWLILLLIIEGKLSHLNVVPRIKYILYSKLPQTFKTSHFYTGNY